MEPRAVLAAAAILEGCAHRTPVLTSHTLDARVGARLYLKAEHLQRTGSFKFRGAYHALARMSPAERARGVLTWSSGNHAAALALSGRELGAAVVVVMPDTALAVKRAAVEGYGAQVLTCPAAQREEVGRRVAQERGLAVVPPYDHEDVIAGQGTATWELLQDAGPLDVVMAPVGGGGLLAGAALAAANLAGPARPQVVGVEPARANDAARSLRQGSIVTLPDTPDTIADGLRTRFLGERNFAVIRQRVDEIVEVDEQDIVAAMRWLWERMKQVVEPTGAVALAGVMAGKVGVAGRRVGILVSGGNAEVPAAAALLSADRWV